MSSKHLWIEIKKTKAEYYLVQWELTNRKDAQQRCTNVTGLPLYGRIAGSYFFSRCIMHDIPVVPNFAMDGVWINYLSDFSERFSETISFSSVDGKEHFSEIIGHSTYLCNPCCDSSHSMAMIWKPVLTWEERKNVVYQIQDSAKCHAHKGLPFFA